MFGSGIAWKLQRVRHISKIALDYSLAGQILIDFLLYTEGTDLIVSGCHTYKFPAC